MGSLRHKEGKEEMKEEMKWNPMDRINETCNLCGCHGAHYCTGKPSPNTIYTNGTKPLQTETNHLDNYLDKNKSWNEFIEWVKIQTRDDNWNGYRDFVKIGLLIEYLKSVGLRHEKEIVLSDLEVEKLEAKVKSLKQVNEVGKLAILLQEHVGTQSNSESTREYMLRIAKEAIEFING